MLARRLLSPLLLLAIALGLLLLSGPPVEGAGPEEEVGAKVSFGLGGTGDGSISVPLPETVEWQQFQERASLQARVTDPEARSRANVIPTADVTWKWYRGNTLIRTITDRNGNTKDANERNYSPVQPADVGHRITVEATYRVRASYDRDDANYHVFLGPEKTVRYTSVNPVQRWRDPTRNRIPEFATELLYSDGEFFTYAAPTIMVRENTRGDIGGPHPARDPDGDKVTYTVRGTDANIQFGVPRFEIDNATGQLRLAPGANLNYETRTSYQVTIRAYDSSANNTGAEEDPQHQAETHVTIQVVDVDETPSWGAGVPDGEILAQTEGRTEIDLDNDRTATPNDLATFVASDPEDTDVTLSLRGPDADAFELAADTDTTNAVSQVLSFRHATDFDMPADSNGDNVYEVTVRASDEIRRTDPSYSASWWNAERTLFIRVVAQSTLDAWTPTLTLRHLGDGRLGCSNNVSGARCAAALAPDRFTVTRMGDGRLSSTVHIVEELYLTSEGELVLTMSPFVPGGFTLSTSIFGTDAGGNPVRGTAAVDFSIGPAYRQQARWQNAGLEWHAGRSVQLGMDRPRATLSGPAIRVHYDADPAVDGFRQWQPARLAGYGYGVRLPGVFSYLDPNNEVKFAHTTHAKVKVFPEFQGSTVRVGKITYSATDDTDATEDPPVACAPYQGLGVVSSGHREVTSASYKCVAFGAVAFAQLSHAIELDAHLPNTGVYIEVTDGSVVKTYFLDIDPPARTYSLSPSASVVEGQDARLTLSLSESAPEAGLEFTVTAAYGTAGSADVGTITSPVTVPGGATSLEISVPTVDDDLDEEDETFTVTVAPVRAGWAVSPTGAGTATVTIADNDADGETEDNKYADLIAKMYGWRNDPLRSSHPPHVERWDRALLAFGEEVADQTLTPMPASEAQGYADRGWTRWVEVTQALKEIEAAAQEEEEQADPPANRAPTVANAIADVSGLTAGTTRDVSLSGVFTDADGDSLTISAASFNDAIATVTVAADNSRLTVEGVAEGTVTITVTARDSDGNTVGDAFDVSVPAPQQQDPAPPANRTPTVSGAISDATIVNESGTHQVSLSGTFSDADNDSLTVTAASSNNAVATVSVAAGYASLTVSAQARGAATITVTAADGNGGSVSDTFTVRVKAAPVVASAISDVTGLEAGATQDISLSGVFRDADGDSLTVTAASSNGAIATVTVAGGGSSLTVEGVSEGTATITVTARDSDGNRVSDTFDVSVEPEPEEEEKEAETSEGAPTVVAPLPDLSLNVLKWRLIDLTLVFSEPDGQELTFSVESSDYGVVRAWNSGSTLRILGASTGTATVTVTARDPDGNKVSDTFVVTVSP